MLPEDKKDEKESLIKDLIETILPKFLNEIEERCGAGEFILGPELQMADFYIGGLYTNLLANDSSYLSQDLRNSVLDKFPNFKAYGLKFAAANQQWLDSRDKCNA